MIKKISSDITVSIQFTVVSILHCELKSKKNPQTQYLSEVK